MASLKKKEGRPGKVPLNVSPAWTDFFEVKSSAVSEVGELLALPGLPSQRRT